MHDVKLRHMHFFKLYFSFWLGHLFFYFYKYSQDETFFPLQINESVAAGCRVIKHVVLKSFQTYVYLLWACICLTSAACCHMCQNNSPPTCSLSAQRVPQLIRSDQAAGLGRGRWHQVASEAASEEGVGRLPGTEHHWGPNAQWRDGRVVYPGYVVTQNSEDYGNKCLRVFVCHLRPKEHLKFNSEWCFTSE